jgi:hypothetical protein
MRCCLVGRVVGEEASASTADLLLVDLEGVTVLHVELYSVLADILSLSYPFAACAHARGKLTLSGVSLVLTLVPSKRKRTLVKDLP